MRDKFLVTCSVFFRTIDSVFGDAARACRLENDIDDLVHHKGRYAYAPFLASITQDESFRTRVTLARTARLRAIQKRMTSAAFSSGLKR